MSPSLRVPWFEELPDEQSWTRLWTGYIQCGHCGGIRTISGPCAACAAPPYSTDPYIVKDDQGQEHLVSPSFAGAEGRVEDYVYLRMMEREWKRPLLDEDRHPPSWLDADVSPRASIVILFWSYFETRIDRLLRAGLRQVPERLLEDTLRRYSAIGPRMNEFYRIVFGTTYGKDLEDAGHGTVWAHLEHVQQRRNRFSHGHPGAIDDALVRAVVENLKIEHEAWIAVFNKRATRNVTPQ